MEERILFHIDTTTQLAGSFLRRAGGKLPYLKLLKLMYYADREMLVTRGTVITYDRWVAMEWGPVLSCTYDLIKRTDDTNIWTEHIRKTGFEVQLIADPGDDELSSAVNHIVDEVFERHGQKEPFDIALETHELGEYENPEGRDLKVAPLEYTTVLEVEGVPFDEIDKILSNIKAEESMDRMLAGVA
jgi:uncharacterized phage-associated protein